MTGDGKHTLDTPSLPETHHLHRLLTALHPGGNRRATMTAPQAYARQGEQSLAPGQATHSQPPAGAVPPAGVIGPSQFQCAICLEDDVQGSPVMMPCCGRAALSSTTQFCRRCIEIICEQSRVKVGMCPRCRSYYSIAQDGSVTLADNIGRCRLCQQDRIIITTDPAPLCSACVMGQRVMLRYQCEGCGRLQRIPHPMWRYQPGPALYSTDTWACHRGCMAQTHW